MLEFKVLHKALNWSSKQFLSFTFDHPVLGQVNNNNMLSNELGERERKIITNLEATVLHCSGEPSEQRRLD